MYTCAEEMHVYAFVLVCACVSVSMRVNMCVCVYVTFSCIHRSDVHRRRGDAHVCLCSGVHGCVCVCLRACVHVQFYSRICTGMHR